MKHFTFLIFIFIALSTSLWAIPENPVIIQSKDYGKILKNTVIVRYIQGYTPAKQITVNSPILVQTVLLAKNHALTYNKSISKSDNMLSSSELSNIITAEEPLLRTFVVEYAGDVHPEVFCKQLLKNNRNIEIAEPYCVFDMLASVPNDPKLGEQTMLSLIKAKEAWAKCEGDPSVVIGISDAGTDQGHEDLENSIAPNTGEIPNNGKDDDNNGYIDDYLGYNFGHPTDDKGWGNTINSDMHGTEVAGIAGATYNNAKGIAGIGGKCKIFPIKCNAYGSNSLPFTYQSITYAAIRGLKVINCSWGSAKKFSYIDQSVIDFAVSRDLVVICSGGNKHTPSGTHPVETDFYPAAYNGVLAVGEVTDQDELSSDVILGAQVRIMAPGKNNMSTFKNSTYRRVSTGSSYASPVVAGAAGIARTKHPSLKADQIIEFLRQCTDDISESVSSNKKLVPGRLNMLKIVDMDPLSIPGIRLLKSVYKNSQLEIVNRFNKDDEVNLSLSLRNFLGAGDDLTFTLSTAFDPKNIVTVLKDEVKLNKLEVDGYANLEGFRFRVNRESFDKMIFRVDISGKNGYKDFFKFNFTPTSDMVVFENSTIKVSMGDNGELGFAGQPKTARGVGFVYGKYGNQLWLQGSGLLVTLNDSKVFYTGSNTLQNIKPFANPKNTSSVRPVGADDTNLQVDQTVTVNQKNQNIMKIHVKLTNKSPYLIPKMAVGYFIDWDIADDSDNNKSELFNSAIPEKHKHKPNFAAEVFLHSQKFDYPVFGAAAYTDDKEAIAQAAVLESDAFVEATQINSLKSGTAMQLGGVSDRAMVIGMNFTKPLAPNKSKEFTIILGGAGTKSQLSKLFSDYIDSTASSVDDKNFFEENGINIFPNPAVDKINISMEKNNWKQITYELCSFDGRILKRIESAHSSNAVQFDVHNLAQGVYFIRMKVEGEYKHYPIVIGR